MNSSTIEMRNGVSDSEYLFFFFFFFKNNQNMKVKRVKMDKAI